MNTKSFTLIEILVAIVIVGILSTFIIISLNSVVDSANDAKRKKDLDSISKMLMTYRILNGFYPDESGSIETALSDLIPDYTTSFPKDPSGLSYNYSSDGETYTLTSQTLSYNSEDGFAEGGGSGPWLTGYSYRKEITLSNSGSELTDYQLKFTINRTAGTDSGFTTYLGTKCLDNYNDIRFTDSSHQVLSYWIESSNSSTATVWVKADTLVGSGNTTLYLYYGNNSASAVSNGDTTFQFFDDFEGGSVNEANWTITGNPSVNNSILSLDVSGGMDIITSKSAYSTNTAIIMYLKSDTYTSIGAWGYTLGSPSRQARFVTTSNWSGAPQNQYAAETYVSSSTWTGLGTTYTGYRKWEIIRSGSSNVYFKINDNQVVNRTSNIPTDSLNLQFLAYSGSSIIYLDWVAIRKYVSVEPTITEWLDE